MKQKLEFRNVDAKISRLYFWLCLNYYFAEEEEFYRLTQHIGEAYDYYSCSGKIIKEDSALFQ